MLERLARLGYASKAVISWILGFVGAGLLAYAFDQALHARYRRIKPVI